MKSIEQLEAELNALSPKQAKQVLDEELEQPKPQAGSNELEEICKRPVTAEERADFPEYANDEATLTKIVTYVRQMMYYVNNFDKVQAEKQSRKQGVINA